MSSLSLSEKRAAKRRAKPFPFMALPSELRLKIYDYYFEGGGEVIDLDPDNYKNFHKKLGIQRTCRTIYREVSHYFYSSRSFRIFPTHPGKYFKTKKPLLARMKPSSRSLITSLELRLGPGWSKPPRGWIVTPALGLNECVNVRRLTVMVECDPSDGIFNGFRRSHGFYESFSQSLLIEVLDQMPWVDTVTFDAWSSVKKSGAMMRGLLDVTAANNRKITWGPERGWTDGPDEEDKPHSTLEHFSTTANRPITIQKMPLDTSTYSMALLRVDGRRWNELRRLHAQIRTQEAADGSSYLEMGHTKVMCVVTGPTEPQRRGGAGGQSKEAAVTVNLVVAGFSSVDRKKRGRNDKRTQELEATIAKAVSANLHTHLFPHSSISISLHVLSQDGSLLAALLNASTLALIDAGIPMTDYIAACTAGSTSTYAAADDGADPLLDLNTQEEQELPYMTVGTLGLTDCVAVLVCESRVQVSRLEGMLAVGVDGCKQVRQFMDRVVKEKGQQMVQEGVVERGTGLDLEMES
ncbi:Exosome complex component SKI6 [Colletotrichum tanaceti]|uniref:Ribosomal RNA-processing protein 41 n=1 Tax=Colletotrichum tanaceti TaxID=1306861 RepID=A0A4U6XB56_9PEZI|nr:Exosome complex component SKI6 [Colletotrichum tanaceti]KAJ0167310.1 Exosome complex component SKI6 [Colletotrichum tanaceti]TKW52921.1 Exosome complex component SKI6 [Colletotrichum tanaceti]